MATLAGATVMVTRPRAQAQSLIQAIESAGAEVVRFPTLEIQPLLPKPLDAYDVAVFISPNAVRCGLDAESVIPPVVIAMGPATHEALSPRVFEVKLPAAPYNTESLLSMPELQEVRGKKIAIVAGVGGRNALQPALERRGARVDKLDVYERTLPASDPALLDGLVSFWSHPQRIIIATSVQTVNNLKQMVPQSDQVALIKTPLLVISQRMAGSEVVKPFAQVVVANSAIQTDMLAALQLWYTCAFGSTGE